MFYGKQAVILRSVKEKTSYAIPLADRASSGFLWLLIQTFSSKISGLVGQLILARLLAPHDYGLVALAYSVAVIPRLLRDNGLLQVLIGKQRLFDRWVSSVFWFDFLLGSVATIILVIAAPFFAAYFHQPQLRGLTLLVASGTLVNALSTVPFAKLYLRLEFKKIAVAGFCYNVGVMLTSITFAWLGFGAYSLLIPLPLLSAVRLAMLWYWAPSRIRPRLGLLRWRHLAIDAFPLAASVLIRLVQDALPSLLLAHLRSVVAAGIYYFGYNLASQALQIMGFNLTQVLLPVLSGLKDDPPRQAMAFLRVLRLTVFVSVPACAVTAILARPAVVIVFGPRWAAAAEVLAVLSIGTPFLIIVGPLMSFLQARQRYNLSLILSAGTLLVALPLIFFGAYLQGPLLVAVGVVVQNTITGPLLLYLSVRDCGVGWREVMAVFIPSLPLAALAVLPIIGADHLWPVLAQHGAANVALGTLTIFAVYLGLATKICHNESTEFWTRLRGLARRFGLPLAK